MKLEYKPNLDAEYLDIGYGWDDGTGKVTLGTNRIFYKDYPRFEMMPLVAQSDVTRLEWEAYWRKAREQMQANPPEAMGL